MDVKLKSSLRLRGIVTVCFSISCASYSFSEELPSFPILDVENLPNVQENFQSPDLIRVIFIERAHTDSPRIYLREVASCEGVDRVCNEVLGLEVSSSAPPKEKLILFREDIEKTTVREFPNYEIEFLGPAKIAVDSDFMTIDKHQVEDYLVSELNRRLSENSSIRLGFVKVLFARTINVFPGAYRLEFDFLRRADLTDPNWIAMELTGRKMIELKYVPADSSQKSQSLKISAHISFEAMIPVARHSVQNGHLIDYNDIALKWSRIDRQSVNAIADVKSLIGKKVKTDVRANTSFFSRNIAMPTLVKRGDSVRVLMSSGGLTVEGEAKALASGTSGESIRIVHSATKKQLMGRVVGEKLVEVKL